MQTKVENEPSCRIQDTLQMQWVYTTATNTVVVYSSNTIEKLSYLRLQKKTRSSSVAVIAARTAYDLRAFWQNIKPVSFTSLRTAGAQDPIQRIYTHPNPTFTRA